MKTQQKELTEFLITKNACIERHEKWKLWEIAYKTRSGTNIVYEGSLLGMIQEFWSSKKFALLAPTRLAL